MTKSCRRSISRGARGPPRYTGRSRRAACSGWRAITRHRLAPRSRPRPNGRTSRATPRARPHLPLSWVPLASPPPSATPSSPRLAPAARTGGRAASPTIASVSRSGAFARGRPIHACSRYEEGRPWPCSTRPGAPPARWSSRGRRTPSMGCSLSSSKPRARQTCCWCATIAVWTTPRKFAETKGRVYPTIGSGRRRPA